MKRMNTLLMVVGMLGLFVGCTTQYRARNLGGNLTTSIPPGQKLVNITWKEDDLWVLTRPMRPDEKPERYTFNESSRFGVFEGSVTIVESR